jgi:hypothetical protein
MTTARWLDPDTTDSVPILLDRNPRFYDITQSLNVLVHQRGVESVWRRKGFTTAASLPYIAARYMNFKDKTRRDGMPACHHGHRFYRKVLQMGSMNWPILTDS